MARLLTAALVAAFVVISDARSLLATTAPAPAAAPATTPTPPTTPPNTVYTFTAASATLDRSTHTLTLAGLGPAVTGTVAADGDSMPLRHALKEVFGPKTFLPLFAGPRPIPALLDGDAPPDAEGGGGSSGTKAARVALHLVPGSAAYDEAAGTLTVGVSGEGVAVEEAAAKAGGIVGAALAHTPPDLKARGAGATTTTLSSAALSLDVAVPQAGAGLARARAAAGAGGGSAAMGKVVAASVP